MTTRWIAILGSFWAGSLAAADPPPSCIAAGVAGEPVLMALAGNQVTYCFDYAGTPRCHGTDLTTGKTSGLPSPASEDTPRNMPLATAAKVKVGDDAAEVCPAGGTCVTIVARSPVDPGLGMLAAANDAGTLLALSSQQWIETYNVATRKRIAKFTTGRMKSSCNWLAWAGDTLVVSERACGKPSGTAWLATKAGKRIAAVGGAKAIQGSSMARVRDTLWAFNTFPGDRVVFQDVTSGKVARTLALGSAVKDATSWIVGDGSHLALVFGGSRAGDVAIVDPATDKVASYPGKRCPP